MTGQKSVGPIAGLLFLYVFSCLAFSRYSFGHFPDLSYSTTKKPKGSRQEDRSLLWSDMQAFCSNGEITPALKRRISKLHDLVEKNSKIKYPNQTKAAFRTPPFDHTYDYHSAVHGMFTLLSTARILGDKEKLKQVVARLSPRRLLEHHRNLMKDKTFEMPYGRVWLLLLIKELEQVADYPDKKALSKIRKEQEAVLFSWFKNPKVPKAESKWLGYRYVKERPIVWMSFDPPKTWVKGSEKYVSKTLRGDHYSWSLNAFLFMLSTPHKPKQNEFYVGDALRRRFLTDLENARYGLPFYRLDLDLEKISKYSVIPWDFAHVPSISESLELISIKSEVEPSVPIGGVIAVPTQRHYRPRVKRPDSIVAKEIRYENTHQSGIVLTNLWLSALKSHYGEGDCEDFVKRFQAIYQNIDKWEKDFVLSSHWLPQFLWLSLYLARGEG